MDAQIPSFFERALAAAGVVTLAPGQPPPPNLIAYGQFSLAENPSLTAQICNTVAQQTNAFWTLTEFRRLQNTRPEKPVEPNPKDPELWPAPGDPLPPVLVAKYGEAKTRKQVAAYNLAQAHIVYEAALLEHQKKLAKIRAVCAANDFSEEGYMVAFCKALAIEFPAFVQGFFNTPKAFWISEKARQRHTFICAGTGAGKSESIKHIIRHYMTRQPETALVILDPHDDLANDVARFEEHSETDRLLYINPTLFEDRYTAFNPFDLTTEENDQTKLNKSQKQFLSALEIILDERFSPAQEALMTACLGVLLHKKDASFADLVTFMDDSQNAELVAYGRDRLPNPEDREFFRSQFYSRNFETSKPALRYRFYTLFRDPTIRQFLCSKSTFDLDAALDARKIICFGFVQPLVSEEAVVTIGQLINAYLVSFAMNRPKGAARYPIHIFADECHYFVTHTVKKMLKETRKFGLYITLATQDINDLGLNIRRAILTNVGSYLIGSNKAECADLMAKEQPHLTSDDIRSLPDLNFYQVDLKRPPIKAKIEVIGDNFARKDEAWHQAKLEQGRLYYRAIHAAPEQSTNPDALDTNNEIQPRKPAPKYQVLNIASKGVGKIDE